MAGAYFNAFISYRHHPVDTAVAAEVQKKLEHFHIPAAIRKKYGIKKFERIFRDSSELRISSDLGAQLDDAIRASDFLIVICSPRYLESSWCLREIEVFLQTHPRDHVLCVLAEGEPPAVFPPILMQESEPLACDYRGKFKDAEKTELPRLACAMIGCSYDELVMRAAQYRRRRTTALVSVILSLAAIAVAYLLYSNAQIRMHYRQTLISESKTLSTQSLDAYASRDRYLALTYALTALPSDDLDRPVTSEAVYALHRAAGAYQLPYHMAETRLFDGAQDFEKLILLEKSGYLAAMDSSAVISVYDPATGEMISSFSVHSAEVLPDLLSTKEGLIVTSSAGLIHAYQPDGTLAWEQDVYSRAPETYSTMDSRIHLTPDDACLGSQDFDAVQVMDAQSGKPVASYQLPENTDGVIRDFAWSPDGNTLAVQLRLDNGNVTFGLFDTAGGAYTAIEGEFSGLENFHWSMDGKLLVFCSTSDLASYSSGSSYQYVSFQDLLVFAYDASGTELFETQVPFSAESYQIESRIFYISEKPILLISASSCLSLLDPSTGETLLSYDLGESIVRLIDVTPYTARLVTSSGQIATVWYRQAESSLEAEFPSGISDTLIEPAQMYDLYRYFVQKDGDIYLFESAYDLSFTLAEEPDGGMAGAPENMTLCGDFAALKEGGDIRFYHLPDLQAIGQKSYGDHKAIRLLGSLAERGAAVVLVIDMDTGKLQLDLLDITSGDVLASYLLDGTEYFFDSGILDIYASYYDASEAWSSKRMLLESQYMPGPSSLVLADGVLAYHEYRHPNRIICLDLETGKDSVIEPSLGSGQKLLNGSFDSSLAPLLFSPDGKVIYSIVREEDRESRGILISVENGGTRILEETESASDLLGAWSVDSSRLAIAASSSILLYGADGSLLTEIPYPGSRPLAMKFLTDGSLAVFYPGGQLTDYSEDGTILHEVRLSYGDLSYVVTSSFQISETKSYLVVLCQDTLEMVDLSTFGSRPDVTASSHMLGYDEAHDRILVYSFRYMDASMTYHFGAFERYSLDELIEKGREELSSIAP